MAMIGKSGEGRLDLKKTTVQVVWYISNSFMDSINMKLQNLICSYNCALRNKFIFIISISTKIEQLNRYNVKGIASSLLLEDHRLINPYDCSLFFVSFQRFLLLPKTNFNFKQTISTFLAHPLFQAIQPYLRKKETLNGRKNKYRQVESQRDYKGRIL